MWPGQIYSCNKFRRLPTSIGLFMPIQNILQMFSFFLTLASFGILPKSPSHFYRKDPHLQDNADFLVVPGEQDLSPAARVGPSVKKHPENRSVPGDLRAHHVRRHIQMVGCQFLKVYRRPCNNAGGDWRLRQETGSDALNRKNFIGR